MNAALQLSANAGTMLVHRAFEGGAVALCGAADPTRPERSSEDRAAAWTLESGTVLTVADGVGGHADGGQAADLAIEALGVSVDAEPSAVRHAIFDAYERANEHVCALGTGAATTLATAIVRDGELRAVQVGDSAVLVIGGRGAIKLQTVAHSPVGYAIEAGLLSEDEAMLHEDRNIVSNVVGTADMRVEVHAPLPLRPRDTVVLATDGVLDNLEIHEIAELVRKGPLEAAAENVLRACQRRMLEPEPGVPSKPDDATVVLFRPRA